MCERTSTRSRHALDGQSFNVTPARSPVPCPVPPLFSALRPQNRKGNGLSGAVCFHFHCPHFSEKTLAPRIQWIIVDPMRGAGEIGEQCLICLNSSTQTPKHDLSCPNTTGRAGQETDSSWLFTASWCSHTCEKQQKMRHLALTR